LLKTASTAHVKCTLIDAWLAGVDVSGLRAKEKRRLVNRLGLCADMIADAVARVGVVIAEAIEPKEITR
jgi:hypothetical protein